MPIEPAVDTTTSPTRRVLQMIVYERLAQTAKWGNQNHHNVDTVLTQRQGGCTPERMAQEYGIPTAIRAKYLCQKAAQEGEVTWGHILVEEVAEAIDAATHLDLKTHRMGAEAAGALRFNLCAELIQVAAVAVAWAEKLIEAGAES
ncbi:Uncharacterised protein [Mycobacteroides abscessus subsp. massiliense]|uniref:hypothetical protein n=1 Tax=Mycobacteroides abscessus TaxID=36809 RepID=UPI0009A6CECF|nr:hypothetical protein [Mycobacteroides abscessus]SKM81814.1 Uncharacterised protein [Mycobacteroides abscessus subsp. massiliense]SKM98486.1 Uncharacterised protein [Mycobacteroides abscessus subsp. massiliense]SKN77144.1 Uncharacterised protein [Mycobacteroides abscessus subsp. massiliense]SKN95986.1 Uncharacterised protein [Mycobacteroides abscessus subsp. massiliense]SKO22450.1 Uncharacterised protein [Mycobacteroides abscessus subsp. massiliense]